MTSIGRLAVVDWQKISVGGVGGRCRSAAARSRRFLVACVVVLTGAVVPAVGEPVAERAVVESAVERGLVRLAESQRGDGSFGSGESRLGSTGLAVRAFLAAGYSPGQGRFGIVVADARKFLLTEYPRPNVAVETEAGLALTFAQLVGVEVDEIQRGKLRGALAVSVARLLAARSGVAAAAGAGGWAEDKSDGGSLRLTAWCVLALKSAEGAGVEVPAAVYAAAGEFALGCRREDGRFADSPAEAGALVKGGAPVAAERAGGNTTVAGANATSAGALVLGLVFPDERVPPEAVTAVEILAGERVGYSDPFACYLPRLFRSAAGGALSTGPLAAGLAAPALGARGADGAFADPSAIVTLTVPWGVVPVGGAAAR